MTATAAARRAFWEGEGRRIAASLDGIAAAVVVGTDLEATALVARGLARAASASRHVALGDLAGDLPPLCEIAGGEDAAGLTDCFRDGLPLNDIARPAPDVDSLFVLPSGTPPVAVPEVYAHERWPRLVAGFAKSGALLLLVAPLDAPGLDALIGATSGVVVVDALPALVKRWPVIATVDAPSSERPPSPWTGRRIATLAAIALLLAVAAAGASRFRAMRPNGFLKPPERTAATAAIPAATPPPPPAPPPDTLRLAEPAPPADSTSIALFAVEVVAANTLTGAKSFLTENGETITLSGATVSPVAIGGGSTLWYKVIVGACGRRSCADSLLGALHRERVIHSGEGRVVEVPYALLLADSAARANVVQTARSWQRRGFNAYALMQSDGSVRLYAGAFETPAQAAPLAAALRAARVTPVVAFRTGRTF